MGGYDVRGKEEIHPMEVVGRVIDAWCGRRELKPLSVLLPGYLAFTDLTDGWAHLLEALDDVRMYYSGLPEDEVDMLRSARTAVYQALKNR